jgi:hypothetical protein
MAKKSDDPAVTSSGEDYMKPRAEVIAMQTKGRAGEGTSLMESIHKQRSETKPDT